MLLIPEYNVSLKLVLQK